MTTSILATKLYIPAPRPKAVARVRLIEQMNDGLHRKLTLISAPAGFGKTTLVSEWLASCVQQAAWLSLDEGDNDPTRFLTYFIAALRTIAPNVGDGVLRALQSPHPPTSESNLTALLNDIATIPDNFILVLDDYHSVDSRPIDHALTFLLEHLPPQMHLVIATREDPQLPLARLRVRDQLTELRVADLRFTVSEATGFLNQMMGLNLSEDDVAALETRTEGWIAGLQLAAISMQGHPDTASFIQSFTGSHHFVLDYLLEEVLHRQSERVQNFLMRTSILDRLCGSLCDALLDDHSVSGQEILETIEQANLFIVPLDSERRWYRYHHLFADLLRQRLLQSAGDVSELHIHASQWHEDNGLEIEAFRHAAAANDVERAERILEGNGMPLVFRGIVTPILNWLDSLPVAIMEARPSLWVWSAHALSFIGQSTTIEQKLQAAEAALQGVALDDKGRNMVGHIAAIRAMQAIPRNQVDILLAQSRRALEYLHADNLPIRMSATWTLGYAYQAQGDRDAAIQAYTDTLSISQATGNFMNTLAAATCLGQVQESQNQLYLAAEHYRHILQLVGDPPLPYACEAFIGLARLCYQWNELDAAEQYARQSAQLAPQLENIDTPAIAMMFLARLKLVQRDAAGAAALLAEAEHFMRQGKFNHLMPEIAAAQVLTLLCEGNLAAAALLAEKHDLPLSRARVHVAQGEPAAALALLESARQQAEAKNWGDECLRVMVLQALAHHAQGDRDKAVQTLDEAMTLAQPGGFIRIFVDEGPPMAQLLSQTAAMPDYTRKLLNAFERQLATVGSMSAAAQPLVEPLSEREVEVLQLVAQGFSNREISERLFLALSTVKGHNRVIFEKLQVQRRTEAVARAREMGIL